MKIDQAVDLLEMLHDAPLSRISDCLRSFLIAAPGKRLIAADFSNIEGRVNAWLAGQHDKVALFEENGPIYERMGAVIFDTTTEAVVAKGKNCDERDLGKRAELGCGFGMGWRKFKGTAKKEANLRLPDELCIKTVKSWRALNDKIVAAWRAYEDAAVSAVLHPGRVVQAGDTPIRYKQSGSFLFAQLPSGRALTYPYPRLLPRAWAAFSDGTTRALFGRTTEELQAKAEKIAVEEGLKVEEIREHGHALTYKGVNSVTRRWERSSAYGGLLCENVVQATARDMLAEAMFRVEKAGYPIVLHVHDELVAEVDDDFGDLAEFEGLMAAVPAWGTGCPVAAEGWVGKRYRK